MYWDSLFSSFLYCFLLRSWHNKVTWLAGCHILRDEDSSWAINGFRTRDHDHCDIFFYLNPRSTVSILHHRHVSELDHRWLSRTGGKHYLFRNSNIFIKLNLYHNFVCHGVYWCWPQWVNPSCAGPCIYIWVLDPIFVFTVFSVSMNMSLEGHQWIQCSLQSHAYCRHILIWFWQFVQLLFPR